MRDILLTAYGYTLSCRVSEASLKLNVSRDIVKEMALEALGRISNESDLKLEDVSVTRNGFKVQFVPDSPSREMSVLQLRSSPRTSPELIDGVRTWGGMFKRVRNYLGLFYLYITKSPEAEANVSPVEVTRSATHKADHTPRSVGLSPVRDRKRELYKTLFDEGIDDTDQSESKEKSLRSLSKAASKKVSSKSSPTTHDESKSSSEERTPSKPKSKETPVKYRRSLIGIARGDETYVPFGETEGVLTYNPSKIGKRTDGAEYIPEYVPTVKEKLSTNGIDSAKYIPSKISSTSTTATKATYVPTEINPKSQSRTQSKPAKPVTYKPSRKKTPEVNEYVPAPLTSEVSSAISYKPTTTRISRLRSSAETKINQDEAYEPTGITDPKLQYRPSQVTTFPSQNAVSSTAEPPLQLRTVRRKQVEISPEKPDAQKRLRYNKATAPEKCLMPDWMFGRMKENQDRVDSKTYSDKEIAQLEADISSVKSLKSLTEGHIRYLFCKLELEIISVAVGKPRRHRHELFMNDQSALLNNAIPIKAVSPHQLDLIKKLCLDHFNKKHGFQIFYVLQVLLPEVIIRLHMLINGTTFEESDRQTDMGIVHLDQWRSDRESL